MQARSALVVGSGLAGPVMAMALVRVGIRPLVVEARSESSGLEGAFLGVAPNGMNALAALGLADAVAAVGHPCHAFEMRSGSDRVLGRIDRKGDAARFGWPLTMVRRADLHRVLVHEAERRGVEIRREVRVTSLERTAQGVRAQMAGGAYVDADLVVGCDGLRSATRASLWPDAPAPRVLPLLDCGGFVSEADVGLEPGVNHLVFGRRAFFGAFVTPRGETWWFHNGPPGDGDLRERLSRLHAADAPWIGQLIAATPRLLGPWALHALPELPTWWRERVCLIGDAAHAMSPSAGQGASLAFEDAVELAERLREQDDPRLAFAAFESARRPRVRAIARQAERHSNDKALGPVGAWLRDRILPWVLPAAGAAQSRVYAYRVTWGQHES